MIRKVIPSIMFFLFLILSDSCQNPPKPTAPSTIRISTENDPQTFDPRKTRDLGTSTVIHMLYEGLMRLNSEGIPTLALAESVHVSDDQKTYTFKLRKSTWSDGLPLTAHDFEKTWKSLLDPNFPAPNAYQLYAIKGAKNAKEGKQDLEQVGIRARNDAELIVELDNPTPHFLSLIASYFYYPVHPTMRQNEANPQKIISNGPFQLEEWSPHNQTVVTKNLHYWDAKAVRLSRITLITLDNATALALFNRGELDWAGSPLSTIPTDALDSLKKQKRLNIAPAAGVYLFRFNTEKAPFDQVKIRQALSLALNRQDLVDHVLQGNQIPAMGLIPPSFMTHTPFFRDYNLTKAQQLFKDALAEKHISKDSLPTITLCYAAGERSHKIAQVAQQQWKQAFGIDIKLQSCESKVFYDQLKTHQYQIAIGSWFADIRDPISFLDVFKFKDNGTNNTQWENPRYVQLLNFSSQAPNNAEREKLLKEAESVLIDDMPVAPLFYSSYNYLKHPTLKHVYFSELGYLDFKSAYLDLDTP